MKVLFFLVLAYNAAGQSPGGIAAGNTMWLRADNGIGSTGTTVNQWQEISGAGVTGNFTVQPLPGSGNTQTGPTILPAGINFNPYLRFNGSTNSLSSTNSFFGTALVSNSSVTIFQVLTVRGGIVWLKWETDQIGTNARLGFENAGGRIRFDFPKADPAAAGQNVGVTTVQNLPTLSTAYVNSTTSVNRINGADNNTIPIPGPGNFGLSQDKIVIGNERLINLPAMVDIAELIIYSNTLSAVERNKVESYLAVKYGFTLNPSGGSTNNYTTSAGVVTWDMIANTGYNNNITGIGRDDATGLAQHQSISVNAGSLVTLYNGTYAGGNFPALNSANTNNFSADGSLLLTGEAAGSILPTLCIWGTKAQRMHRTWKVSKTGAAGPVTISVNQAAVAASIKNIIVSTDPGFPQGSTTIYPLSVANGKLYSTVPLSGNDYFSFMTDTLVVNMVLTNPDCSNANSGQVTTTVSGGTPPYTFFWNPSAQVTANLVNAAAGTYQLIIQHGGCGFDTSITLIAPPVPAAPLANGTAVCAASAATIAVQSPVAGFTYNWYTAAIGGTLAATGISFTTPVLSATTTWYVEAVNAACASVRTAVPVTVTTVSAPVVNGVTICTGNPVPLTIQNPVSGYTYHWYTVASGGTSISTGTLFNTPVVAATSNWYVEATNGSCNSSRIQVTVTVNPLTAHTANPVSVCTGTTATLTVQNPTNNYTFNWYTAATGGTAVANGISFTTPVVSSNTTWYLESVTNGCPSVRTAVLVTVNGINAPLASAVSICTGTSAALTVQNPNAAYTYNWFTAATGGTASGSGVSFTSPVLTIDTAFYVEAALATCTSTRTRVAVQVTTIAAPTASGATVCAGSTALLNIQNPNSNYAYNWFAASTGGIALDTGNSFVTPAVIAPVSYFASATDGTCSSLRTSVPVSITPALRRPVITIGTITTGSIVFNWQAVAGATGYLVAINGGTAFSTGTNTTYTVTGLATSETVSIQVTATGTAQTCGDSGPASATATTYQSGFYMPTAFTPNDDPNNNTIKPSLPGSAFLQSFIIYNRWGQAVFASSKIGDAWNGKLKDKPQPMGTYAWVCSYRNLGRTFTEKGSFLLLR